MPLRPGARAWAVWAVGLAAYIVAVLHRTSLGVAGLYAQQRFGIGAGTLGLFAVLQPLVYAGLRVPVGMFINVLRLVRWWFPASYGVNDFKLAMSVQYLVGAIGLVGILRTRRLARTRPLADEGIVVRPLREVLAEWTRSMK